MPIIIVIDIYAGFRLGSAFSAQGLLILSIVWGLATYWASRDDAAKFFQVSVFSWLLGAPTLAIAWIVYVSQLTNIPAMAEKVFLR